jgi:Transposase DDE domain
MKVTPDQRSQEIARVLRSNLPTLTKSEARLSSEWLVGIIIFSRCGLTAISAAIAMMCGQKPDTVRQRLREIYQPSTQKRGHQRRVLRVSRCFKDLLRWIIRLWDGKHICIALDAVFSNDTLVVLCYSVLYRGCALPFSWKVLHANRKGAHLPAILTMLRRFKGIIPPGITVLFLSDRGLWSPELFHAVRSIAWHPMMRVQAGAYFRAKRSSKEHEQAAWKKLNTLIVEGHDAIALRGDLFKTHSLPVTLLACWEKGHKEAWFIASDLPPSQCTAPWYGLRMWIEQGFKTVKSAGCDWEHSRITDPARAERMWLVYALAALWFHAIATIIEVKPQEIASVFPKEMHVALNAMAEERQKKRPRTVRLYWLGQVMMLMIIVFHHPLIIPSMLVPEPLPKPRKASLP